MDIIPKNVFSKANMILSCPSCKSNNVLPVVGWSVKACSVCNNQICFPASLTKTGYQAKGQKTISITTRTPEIDCKWLDHQAKLHECSRSSFINHLIRVSRLSDA